MCSTHRMRSRSDRKIPADVSLVGGRVPAFGGGDVGILCGVTEAAEVEAGGAALVRATIPAMKGALSSPRWRAAASAAVLAAGILALSALAQNRPAAVNQYVNPAL